MDEEILFGLKHFERVWKRVESGVQDDGKKQRDTSPGEADILRVFMENAAQMTQLYRDIAKTAGGSLGSRIMKLSFDEQKRLTLLGAEYFLVTGNRFNPGSACPRNRGLINALRQCHRIEEEFAEKYNAQAQRTRQAARAGLYAELANGKHENARQIRKIIARILYG